MNETTVTVLAVLASPADRHALGNIIGHSHWRLRFAEHLGEARAVLGEGATGVVISDCAFSDGHSWKDVLSDLDRMHPTPPLIVTDRLVDERLWSEVLNHGCYDLLAKPFETKEVLRIVSSAWQSWRSRTHHAVRQPAASERMPSDRCVPSLGRG
jgi:DNA-binding NtrC family response regulator